MRAQWSDLMRATDVNRLFQTVGKGAASVAIYKDDDEGDGHKVVARLMLNTSGGPVEDGLVVQDLPNLLVVAGPGLGPEVVDGVLYPGVVPVMSVEELVNTPHNESLGVLVTSTRNGGTQTDVFIDPVRKSLIAGLAEWPHLLIAAGTIEDLERALKSDEVSAIPLVCEMVDLDKAVGMVAAATARHDSGWITEVSTSGNYEIGPWYRIGDGPRWLTNNYSPWVVSVREMVPLWYERVPWYEAAGRFVMNLVGKLCLVAIVGRDAGGPPWIVFSCGDPEADRIPVEETVEVVVDEFGEQNCGRCCLCLDAAWAPNPESPVFEVRPSRRRMVVCATCGNKRCPHATDHHFDCTGSNEPGQAGSIHGGMRWQQ